MRSRKSIPLGPMAGVCQTSLSVEGVSLNFNPLSMIHLDKAPQCDVEPISQMVGPTNGSCSCRCEFLERRRQKRTGSPLSSRLAKALIRFWQRRSTHVTMRLNERSMRKKTFRCEESEIFHTAEPAFRLFQVKIAMLFFSPSQKSTALLIMVKLTSLFYNS